MASSICRIFRVLLELDLQVVRPYRVTYVIDLTLGLEAHRELGGNKAVRWPVFGQAS